jgi:glycosyltransferase involved in cell wall biosynthesis
VRGPGNDKERNAVTVYVLSPENNKPSGGIKILYRHVDVLNRNGIDAALLHQNTGFRCTWFENETRVAYLDRVQLSGSDFLVIPEIYGPNILAMGDMPMIGRKARKVVFNQNCRYTFLGQTLEAILQPDFDIAYRHPDEFVGVMVVSEDSRKYLEYVFPRIEVWRIHNAINVERFAFSERKRRQICFMPRKNTDDALQVLAILKLHGSLDGFEVVAIENSNEAGVARIMKESLIFLSFGYPEGCPLPPAEAMASGCIVVGYDGYGGREYFDDRFTYPIPVGDITGFSGTVEKLISLYRENPDALGRKSKQASEYIRDKYSPQREQADILNIWNRLLS